MIGDRLFTEEFPLALQNLVYTQFIYVHLSKQQHYFYSYFFGSLGTFPIDTTKTRLQIQGQKCDGRFSTVRYNGMFHALSRITKEEGIRALYSGYIVTYTLYQI